MPTRGRTGPLRGREKPLGLKTELELRFANRLMLVLIRFRIEKEIPDE
jgi:hypothetical protein